MANPSSGEISEGRRRAVLQTGLKEAEARAHAAGHPFEVLKEDDFEVMFAVTQPPNHWLHKRLTIQTLGLWSPVWLVQTLRGSRRRVFRVTVSPKGTVRVMRVRE